MQEPTIDLYEADFHAWTVPFDCPYTASEVLDDAWLPPVDDPVP